MSHAKERKENNCLNCNAIVAGRFCQVCGQENIEVHQTFGHLAGHLVSDIFHFDGKFFSTSKYLLFSPGFLTHEYVRGRRASYLDPVKMYVFVSAIFFLFFLSFYKPDVKMNGPGKKNYSTAEVIEMLRSDLTELENAQKQKAVPGFATDQINKKKKELQADIAILQKDTTRKTEIFDKEEGPTFFGKRTAYSEKEYDSLQEKLPAAKREGWFQRKLTLRNIQLTDKYNENQNEFINGLLESFLHHSPQMFFISLPLFALILRLLYVRRKQFVYPNHLIYTSHLYSAVFVFAFVILLLSQTESVPYFGWLQWIRYTVILYATYYTYKSLHEFYGQSRGKTIAKWLILMVTAFFIIIILFICLFLFTILMM